MSRQPEDGNITIKNNDSKKKINSVIKKVKNRNRLV